MRNVLTTLAAGLVLVFIHANPFRRTERQYAGSEGVGLSETSSDASKFIQAAFYGFGKIFGQTPAGVGSDGWRRVQRW